MVGYYKAESMTPQEKLIAGCFTGVITRFATQPLDLVKLRTQLMQVKKETRQPSMLNTFLRILREEGIRTFWHGHFLGQVHSVLSVSTQFYFYELTTKLTKDVDPAFRGPQKFFCGVASGCLSTFIVIPFEVIRVRQMVVKEQYSGIIGGAKRVYKTGGILAFYEGLSASVLQMGPQVGISFLTFSVIQSHLLHYFHNCPDGICDHGAHNKYRPETIALASSIAGAAAGFFSKTLTYPFDLAKRRLQIGTHRKSKRFSYSSTTMNLIKCRSLIQCIRKTFHKEGIRGLYRGWLVTVSKAQVTSVVAFTSYELICYAMREYK